MLKEHAELAFRVELPDQMTPYAESAVARLGYLHPNMQFSIERNTISILGASADLLSVKQDVLHAVYREKIFADSLELRHSLLRAVLR